MGSGIGWVDVGGDPGLPCPSSVPPCGGHQDIHQRPSQVCLGALSPTVPRSLSRDALVASLAPEPERRSDERMQPRKSGFQKPLRDTGIERAV